MKAKKSLGQNFFVNKSLGEKIVRLVLDNPAKTIIEIGPGTGFFTEYLAQHAKLIAIEKDFELSNYLKTRYPNVEIINSDFLDLYESTFTNYPQPISFFGSLPYNVSKQIIRKCIAFSSFSVADFIIQKEVAEKYTQKDGRSSVLSLTTKLFADSQIILDIEPGSFRPIPKVKSSLIHFKKNDNEKLVTNQTLFYSIVKTAFTSPRKKLSNNLKRYILSDPLLDRRAEELSFEDYLRLTNNIDAIIVNRE